MLRVCGPEACLAMLEPRAVKRPKRPSRPRTLSRELRRDREHLLRLEPGGSRERPIEVESASLVEPRAESVHCPVCGSAFAVEEHLALTTGGVRLREARVRCRQCGAQRSLWFRIVGPALH